MSIIGQGASAPASGLVKWTGYGLCGIGALLPLAPAAWGGEATAALALITPAVIFTLLLLAPDAFGSTWRDGRTRSVSVVLLAPVFVLVAAAFSASVLDLAYAAAPAAICVAIAVLLGLGAAARPMPGALWTTILFLALYGAGYGFGGLVFADMRFDHGAPQVFQTAVQARYTSHGRSGTGYHLTLAPFGPLSAPAKVHVSPSAYAALNVGDIACVTLHPGALKMAWYTAGVCSVG